MFKKYPKIENAYKEPVITAITNRGIHKKTKWHVFEKIDGSNLGIIVTDNGIEFMKRTSIIKAGDGFFNIHRIKKKYTDCCLELYQAIKHKYKDVVQIILYGELYGGIYPDHEVDKYINRNVFYSPTLEYIAFDLLLKIKDTSGLVDERFEQWLTYDEYAPLLQKALIPYLKPLMKGTFEEALQYQNDFVTTLPALHGLKPTETNNIVEGVVIKPVKNILLKDSKIMIKNKNNANQEIMDRSAVKKKFKVNVPKNLPSKIEAIYQYITAPRLNAVLSKIGVVQNTKSNFRKVLKAFSADILEEYASDYALSKKELKQVKKIMGSATLLIVREYLESLGEPTTE
jgi:Rnl2 family RNA ligase